MLDLSAVAAISLKTTLLIIAVGLVSVVMARNSAAYRHFLWTSALTLSLLMPFAIVYLPSYDLNPLPWRAAERLVQLSAHAQAETLWPTILIIWFSGALSLLIRNAVAHAGLIRWVRRARPLGAGRWAATLDRVSNELGFTGSLRVLESARVVGPCTWGLVQPVLLLPSAGGDWPESQRRHALLHELAHIRRFDYLSNLVSALACAVHWYNPVIWFAASQARKLQEQACDDAVLLAGGKPSEYAQFLLNVAEGSRGRSGVFDVAMGVMQRSHLHARVVAILDSSRTRGPMDVLALFAAFVPLACVMFFLATASAGSEPAAGTSVAAQALDPLPLPAIPAIPTIPAIPATPAMPATPTTPAKILSPVTLRIQFL